MSSTPTRSSEACSSTCSIGCRGIRSGNSFSCGTSSGRWRASLSRLGRCLTTQSSLVLGAKSCAWCTRTHFQSKQCSRLRRRRTSARAVATSKSRRTSRGRISGRRHAKRCSRLSRARSSLSPSSSSSHSRRLGALLPPMRSRTRLSSTPRGSTASARRRSWGTRTSSGGGWPWRSLPNRCPARLCSLETFRSNLRWRSSSCAPSRGSASTPTRPPLSISR
mmetsp:Transcript_21202/g.51125  ORF Transcript_21202/g.51125 Transcript_21202/m.51125 type:complete len:221 (-) Transcript_21202:1349-2011(-)